MKLNSLKIGSIVLLAAFVLPAASPALAAALFFVPSPGHVTVGDVFPVEIRLDAGGQAINAVEADFNYSKALIRVNGVDQNGSILRYWPVDPGYSDIFGVGSVSGGLPSPGFSGRNGLLAKVMVEALHPGTLQLSFRANSRVLLNDGMGTPAHLELRPAQVAIAAAASGYEPKQPVMSSDTAPPEPFNVVITRTPNAFDGRYFAVFSAQDRDSGIDHYEVMEIIGDTSAQEPVATDLRWRVAESPYLLKNQHGPVTLFVKAVDRAGNFRIARATLGNVAVKADFRPAVGIIVFLIVLLVITYGWGWRRARTRRQLSRRNSRTNRNV